MAEDRAPAGSLTMVETVAQPRNATVRRRSFRGHAWCHPPFHAAGGTLWSFRTMRFFLLSPAAFAPPDGRAGAPATPDPDSLLSEGETCGLTGLAERTLQRKRLDGTGPRFVRLGRRVLYRRRDVLEWIEANTHDSTSAATVAAQRGGRAA